MKPKIYKRDLVWICEGTVHRKLEKTVIFGMVGNAKEAYADFMVKAQQWKFEKNMKDFSPNKIDQKEYPSWYNGLEKCLSCKEYHPMNTPCPHTLTWCSQ